MEDRFLVGRQPLFDHTLEVTGYRLMAGSPAGSARGADSAPHVASVLGVAARSGMPSELSQCFGEKLVFVPALGHELAGEGIRRLPAAQTVVEVAGSDLADRRAVEACNDLAALGYRLSVDVGIDHAFDGPLLRKASYVKFETGFSDQHALARHIQQWRAAGAKVVAKRVDSLAQVEASRSLGSDLFEGYLLSEPVVSLSDVMTPSRLACLQILDTLYHPDTSAQDICRIVESEPGLTFRILHVSSLGTESGLQRTVRSIQEAVVLLGREKLTSLLILMMAADAHPSAPEQLSIALTRARMCKLMARSMDGDLLDPAYTVGLVSALNLLLGTTVERIVENLAIDEEVRTAVVGHRGRLGAVLADVMDWEAGRSRIEIRSPVDPSSVQRYYLDAMQWATSLCRALERSAALEEPAGAS